MLSGFDETGGITGGPGGGPGRGEDDPADSGDDTAGSDPEGGGEGDPKFDLSDGDTGGPSVCETECCPYEFSIIWIANDYQGTVSKIDTNTLVELGRYYTNATQGAGRPSRTSVNLLGDVAISNRDPGSVTKIAAQLHNCVDSNGDGSIQTSSGANDVPASIRVDSCASTSRVAKWSTITSTCRDAAHRSASASTRTASCGSSIRARTRRTR